MQIAVCLSGYPKLVDRSINTIKKIKENGDVKMFAHFWQVQDLEAFKKTCWTPISVDDLATSSPYDFQSCSVQCFDTEKSKLENILKSHVFTYYTRRDIGPISMYHSLNMANNLKAEYETQNNMVFDCVIRMRFDSNIKGNFNLLNYDLTNLNIPHGKDFGGVNDQFAFGNSSVMDKYSNLIHNITGNVYHPETLLKNYLDTLNIKIDRPYINVGINNE
jgi:hypothetical protein